MDTLPHKIKYSLTFVLIQDNLLVFLPYHLLGYLAYLLRLLPPLTHLLLSMPFFYPNTPSSLASSRLYTYITMTPYMDTLMYNHTITLPFPSYPFLFGILFHIPLTFLLFLLPKSSFLY